MVYPYAGFLLEERPELIFGCSTGTAGVGVWNRVGLRWIFVTPDEPLIGDLMRPFLRSNFTRSRQRRRRTHGLRGELRGGRGILSDLAPGCLWEPAGERPGRPTLPLAIGARSGFAEGRPGCWCRGDRSMVSGRRLAHRRSRGWRCFQRRHAMKNLSRMGLPYRGTGGFKANERSCRKWAAVEFQLRRLSPCWAPACLGYRNLAR